MNKIKVLAAVAVVIAVAAGAYFSAGKNEPVQTAAEPSPAAAEAQGQTAAKLADNRVYVMYVESCPMCAKALEYINSKYADNAAVVKVDLNTADGKALLNACREKFGFKDVVIPLICAKGEYTMGWSAAQGVRLDGFVQSAAE